MPFPLTISNAFKVTCVALFLAGGAAALFADFDVHLGSVLLSLLASGIFWGLSRVYTVIRPDERIAKTTSSVAFMIFVTPCIALISYAMVTLNLPLIDHQLASIDKAMGIDWLGMLAFAGEYPLLVNAMSLAYHSSAPQMLMAILILGLSRHHERMQKYILTYAWTVFIVVIVSGLMPAIGAYEYYQPASELKVFTAEAGIWHLEHFNALRDGTFNELRFDQVEGLVTFPSFHTTLALLTVWCFWPMKWLRWPILVLNIFVLLGTVLEGGHHVIDMFAGAALAFAAIAVVNRLSADEPARAASPMRAEVSPVAS